MGGGTFGIEAAADFYFGKSVKDLNLAEAAMLAGLFKAPARYAPHVNLPAARERANQVLTNLVQGGFMTEGQVIGARRHPADVVPQATAASSPDFFLDWAFQKVKDFNPKDHIVTVRTTVDMGIQAATENAIEDMLRQHGPQYRATQSAAVVMDTDGNVRAMVGGRDYGESQFNRAVDSLRQPGSSFKPFVYATALMNGFTPDSIVVDAPICIGNWCPHNFSPGYRGRITMTTALINSINTVAVRLAQAVGRDKIVATAKAMGVTTDLRITRSLPLGTSEVSMIEMAGAYGAFASGGYKVTPRAFTQIISSTGEILYDARRDAQPRVRVLPEKVVAGMNLMMSQVPERGTGRAAKLDGIKTAGKTGTSSSFRDAWFDGFTGNYVGIVWYGNDNFTPMRRMTGGALPAMTWKRFMTYAHQGIELKPIPYVEPEKPAAVVAEAKDKGSANPDDAAAVPHPSNLSVATTQWLNALQSLMENAAPVKPMADLKLSAPVTVVAGEAEPAAAALPAEAPR
jgi:penicillin-binding protein 1A